MTEHRIRDDAAPRPTLDVGSLIYSQALRGIAYQLLLGLAVVGVGYYLYANVSENLSQQGIETGFRFLSEKAGFDIGESVIPYDSADTYARALWVGILNTLTVSACGIVLATILGVTIGIGRVSDNWFAATFASGYVETMRNIPVVLHVIFWGAFLRNLPGPKHSWSPWDGLYLNNRGLIFAVPVANPVYVWVGLAFVIAVAAAAAFAYWARRERDRTGRYIHTMWPMAGIVIGLPLVVWLIGGAPLQWNAPGFRGFNFRGGASLTPEFMALLIGITAYTAAFIAEVVRAGIQSVPKGQIEAARALGLRPGWIMRYVTLPQALRVIVPPTTSQYLSLTKNSSLGVLIGYPDLVNVGNTTLNQTGQAVEAIAIMMMVYLLISLTISIAMNFYNRAVALTER
ncbi:MAG: ABC transporter permease subunit [Hyphomicrobiaceae bacterium]|nr:ABC transporter permease subunit [Hyphomicrobiaceae bacterium]